MTEKYFLITAGGTGMRCLQAFVNMCAIGMCKEKEIHCLVLDTDAENKDKKNSENLIRKYAEIREEIKLKEGFFSAEIKSYDFVPNYTKEDSRTFTRISQLERGNSKINRQVADVLYDENDQEFDLAHGYRARTHLGSYLMYHAIIDEIRKANTNSEYKANSKLYAFLEAINQGNNQGGSKVFVLGSTFGGTGASTLPIVPKAIKDGLSVISRGMIKYDNVFFGAVILTDYFNFSPPSEEQRISQKIIADSQFFPFNSAAALQYYIHDKTIIQTYKHLFFLGWPFEKKSVTDYRKKILGENEQETITGGAKQENPAHLLEIMAACSAIYFYNLKTDDLKNTTSLKYWFKAIGIKGNTKSPVIVYKDIVPEDMGLDKEMSRNLKTFYSFCMMIKTEFDGKIENFIQNLQINNFNVSVKQCEALNYFINYFTYEVKKVNNKETLVPMWLPQVFYTLDKESDFLEIPKESLDVMSNGQSHWGFVNKLKRENNPYDKFLATLKKVSQNKCNDASDLFSKIYDAYSELI